MRSLVSGLSVAALLVCLAGPATAQQETKHNGWWTGIGLGGGWTGDDISDSSLTGGAGFLRLGGTLSQVFLVGGDVSFWVQRNEAADEWISRMNITGSAFVFPFYPMGLYIKLGAGLGVYDWVGDTDVEGLIPPAEKDYGFGATGGIGWDIQLARNFFVTPNVDFLWQNVSVEDQTVKAWAVLITVGATWH